MFPDVDELSFLLACSGGVLPGLQFDVAVPVPGPTKGSSSVEYTECVWLRVTSDMEPKLLLRPEKTADGGRVW